MSSSLYDYLFIDLADSRVYDWLFMSDPGKILGVIGVYLFMIYVYLPSYMSDKKPYTLKGIIAAYNVFQVFACFAIIYGMATSGWTTHYHIIGCEPVDYSQSKMAVRIAKFMWWYMMLKVVELFETVLFVLRKKFTQVSFLHVYHHVSTLTMAWLVCKYVPAMSPGPQLQKTLTWIKPKLTMIQLIQLVIIIVQSMQLFLPGCNIHNIVGFIYLPNVCINVILFLNFYTKSYRSKNVSKIN